MRVGYTSKISAELPIRQPVGAEQRKEFRVRLHRTVRLHIRGDSTITATLYDVSKSGVAVDVDRWVSAGARVRIDGFATEGKVRYCQPRPNGYRLGISRSTDTINSSARVSDTKNAKKHKSSAG
jgi:hypothetical protein